MRRIKISELAVGDWVAVDNVSFKGHGNIATAFAGKTYMPICVQSILGEDKLIFARVAYVTLYTKEENLFPIRITPEILEANGFIKWMGGLVLMGDEVSCRYEDGDLTIERHYRDDEEALVERRLVNIECLYVHQLQHALRLAGVEKEIIMPKCL